MIDAEAERYFSAASHVEARGARLFEPADGGSGKTAVGPVVARKSSIEAGQKKLVKNRRKKERESKDGGFVRQSRERLRSRRRADTGREERVEPEARWLERKRKENKWRETRGLKGREYEEPRNTMEIHVIVLCTNVAV